MPHVREYRQHHFSAEDHGFWRSPAMVGATVPVDWRIDGMPEVEFDSAGGPLLALWPAVKSIFPDEANAFERMLCHLTGPRGGRRHRASSDQETGARAVVLIRRRPRVSGHAFRRFVHGTLASALAAGSQVTELRTHVFLPYSALAWPTPGVAHDNPPHRRYHAAVVLGAPDRAGLDAVMAAPSVVATEQAQYGHCLALHAYAVEETVAVITATPVRAGLIGA